MSDTIHVNGAAFNCTCKPKRRRGRPTNAERSAQVWIELIKVYGPPCTITARDVQRAVQNSYTCGHPLFIWHDLLTR